MLRDLIPWGLGRRGAAAEGARDAAEHPLAELHREMHRVFDDFWRGFDLEPFGGARSTGATASFVPRVEVTDAADKVTVTAELPGLSDKDVKVSLQDGALTIEGERRRESTEERGEARYSEMRYGAFARTVPLRAEIDPEKVNATFKNGVLTVELAKTQRERESARRIEVKAG